MSTKPAEQHLVEIECNRLAWERKPLLKKLYGEFYRLIRQHLSDTPGSIVELGSGIGAIKEFIPDCITTDIFPNPWIERLENAYRLSFETGTISNLILLDVFHHLQYPGTALNEFNRVLSTGGRLLLLEPYAGFIGRTVYGLFHHEPLGLNTEIAWNAPNDFEPHKGSYYAAQGNASRIFCSGRYEHLLRIWRVLMVRRFSCVAYLASGGFSKPQLYPTHFLSFLQIIDRTFSTFPTIFGARMLVVLERVRN
ncbi:MAG: methyltransferase domain-containing protein [Verrucomicrobia bacterium]|nr:methyltransferase domain-containing protein [Verrucomicrobiota bacterium]MBV8277367.1 methyltransferase domain-containing protein [Verrucomicrobiota bacterium]